MSGLTSDGLELSLLNAAIIQVLGLIKSVSEPPVWALMSACHLLWMSLFSVPSLSSVPNSDSPLSSHPSVAWLPPFQSGNQRLQIGEIRSITHKGNVISWNVCFRSEPQIAISLSITYLECQQSVYHGETDNTRRQSGWMDR